MRAFGSPSHVGIGRYYIRRKNHWNRLESIVCNTQKPTEQYSYTYADNQLVFQYFRNNFQLICAKWLITFYSIFESVDEYTRWYDFYTLTIFGDFILRCASIRLGCPSKENLFKPWQFFARLIFCTCQMCKGLPCVLSTRLLIGFVLFVYRRLRWFSCFLYIFLS